MSALLEVLRLLIITLRGCANRKAPVFVRERDDATDRSSARQTGGRPDPNSRLRDTSYDIP